MSEISTVLTLPESKTLEFKQDLSSLQPILKTIVAFANTAGGILIIGVKPDGKVVGLPDVLKAEEKLANAIADSIAPAVLLDVEVATVNKKNILVVKVSHWRGPFYLKKYRVIAKIFHELKLMEEWGSGYKRVKDACLHGNYPQPEWVEQGTSMRVIFFFQQNSHHNNMRKKTLLSTKLSMRQQAIINLSSLINVL